MNQEQIKQALAVLAKALAHHSENQPARAVQSCLALHLATHITSQARQTKKGLYILNRAEVFLLADQAAKNVLEMLDYAKINIHDKHPIHHRLPAFQDGDTTV